MMTNAWNLNNVSYQKGWGAEVWWNSFSLLIVFKLYDLNLISYLSAINTS
jgi:hypothetical protein